MKKPTPANLRHAAVIQAIRERHTFRLSADALRGSPSRQQRRRLILTEAKSFAPTPTQQSFINRGLEFPRYPRTTFVR